MAIPMSEEEKSIQDLLSLPILLSERLIKSAQEYEPELSSSTSCKPDPYELAKQSTQLANLLRSTVRLTTASPSLYHPPLRRILSSTTQALDRALALLRKHNHRRRRGILSQLFSISTTADFRKVSNLLDSSMADITWLLSIYESDAGSSVSLPPIASNEPNLAMVWSYIALVQMGQPKDRIDGANDLASIASDNDRIRQMIIQENGVGPLLKLLKEGPTPEAQISAATALLNLATDSERVRVISDELAVPIIVKVLATGPMEVQLVVLKLVSRMAELDSRVQEEFGRENVTRALVTLLGMDIVLDETKSTTSLHSLVKIKKEMDKNGCSNDLETNSLANSYGNGSSKGGSTYKNEPSPDIKLRVKIGCAWALWKLSKGSLVNSRKITETKALICLAKLIESEKEELQVNCLLAVKELAVVAESNTELRRLAFKRNSAAARSVIDQLLRVLNEESNLMLVLPAIKTIGSLARTFSAKETQVIKPLVTMLGNRNADVAVEAAIALGKFVNTENFNCVEHSKAIIEFEGVPRLMSLVRKNNRGQVHELELLCYLALNVGNSKALEEARPLSVLEGAARNAAGQNPDFRELLDKAIHHLIVYQAGAHTHKQAYSP